MRMPRPGKGFWRAPTRLSTPPSAGRPSDPGTSTAASAPLVEGSVGLLHRVHAAGIRRFAFLSSVAVHHDISPSWAGVIDKEHPLRPGSLYGASKAAVEAHLWDAKFRLGMHTVAIRPAAVYGVEPVRLERSHGYEQVRRLLDGRRVVRSDFPGGGKFVRVDDVALAVCRAVERAEQPDVSGRAFHLADCYAKFTRFGEHAAALLGLPASMVEADPGPPSRNVFDKSATRAALGVEQSRGDAGLRAHVADLIRVLRRPV
jgi:dTDP-glucose 4,6-dehydratase